MPAHTDLFEGFCNYIDGLGLENWTRVKEWPCAIKHVITFPSRSGEGNGKQVISTKVEFVDLGTKGMPSLAEKGASEIIVSCYRFARCDKENYASVMLRINERNRTSGGAKLWLDFRNGMLSAEASTFVAGELAPQVCLWHVSALESAIMKALGELGDLVSVKDDLDGFFDLILNMLDDTDSD